MKITVPYEQGALDSLCGVYSLINAMRILIKDLNYTEAERVFRRILQYVESKKRLSSVMTGGIGDRDVFNIARTVLHAKYNISIKRLYGDDQRPSVSKIVAKMAKLLRDENVAIIISIEAVDYEHWSVIKSLSAKEIQLCDSAGTKRVQLSKCTTKRITQSRPVLIDPSSIFCLTRINHHSKTARNAKRPLT
jgi:hypothetical protein